MNLSYSLTSYTCERLIFYLFFVSDGFLEKTLRFLDLLSSIGVGGSRSVLERTLYTTFYTMIIIFDIMSWSFLTAFLWFSDWSHTAAQKPSSEQGMVWLKVTSRCDRGRNWAVAHPTATGSKWLTFCFATMIQRNESAHTAWRQIMVSDRAWYRRHRADIALFFLINRIQRSDVDDKHLII